MKSACVMWKGFLTAMNTESPLMLLLLGQAAGEIGNYLTCFFSLLKNLSDAVRWT